MLGHSAKNCGAKGLPRIVDGLAQRFVEIAPAAADLHDIGMIQAHLRRLHARETLRAQMNLLLAGHADLPTRPPASAGRGRAGGGSGAGAMLTSCGAGTGIALHTAEATCASSSSAATCTVPQQ